MVSSHESNGPEELKRDLQTADQNGRAILDVVEAIGEAQSTEEAIDGALTAVRYGFGWDYAAYWRFDSKENALKFVSDSGKAKAAFCRATHDALYQKGEGLNGLAWKRRDVIFNEDLGEMKDCCRSSAARRSGIKSGVSIPLTSDGEVVGAVDFVSQETQEVSESRLDALRTIGRIISNALSQTGHRSEGAALSAVVEASPTPIILADLDFNITYMNPISLETLKKIAQYLPCRPEEIVGKNVDFFYKDPAYQRRILGNNGANLPTQAIIEVGPEKLDLLVSAITNSKGEFLGPMVTWSLVTQKLKAEFESAKMSAMIDNNPVNIILADKDLNITYVNRATVKNLQPLAHLLPVPIDKIVGSNVDIFLKTPTVQRNILADPNNLPHQMVIELGDQKLDLLVTAIYDNRGDYIGPMVTSENVTSRLKLEQKTKEMMDNAQKHEAELKEKVEALLNTVEAAAEGDLTKPVTVRGDDAIGQLAAGLERMIGGLRDVITRIGDSVAQVSEGATQVSSSSQLLAEGASEQASSLEEVSSALEELTAMTRTNSENSIQADQLAVKAREAADKGGEIVTELNGSMQGISEASDKIGKIIKVIEEIAFQTNLLALNAAVEAARAGEHGKGFAVVAEEVRNLAGRASDAAKEITGLIENSNKRSQDGVKIAGDVGTALNTILDDVRRVSDLIEQIATASQEQTQGIEQINASVSQMDKVTQQNAAGAEESASAAEQMNAQMFSLREMCERFQVDEGESDALAGTRRTASGPAQRQPSWSAPKAQRPAPRPAQSSATAHMAPPASTTPAGPLEGYKGGDLQEF